MSKIPLRVAGHGLPIENLFGYSGVCSDGVLAHVAGQLARDAEGEQIPGDYSAKLAQCYQNIAVLLQKIDLGIEDVVQIQLHVTEDLESIRAATLAITADYCAGESPAVTVVRVAGLNDVDGLVEVSAVAGVQQKEIHSTDSEVTRVLDSKSVTMPTRASVGLPGADGVQVSGYTFVSGQMAIGADGRLVAPGDLVSQFDQALKNVGLVLEHFAMSLENVIALDIFVTQKPNAQDFIAFCDVHRNRMRGVPPTGTMVQVVELPIAGALVCVSAIAVA